MLSSDPVTPAFDTVLSVDTPEHLVFQIRIAGPTRRALAWFLDLAVRGVLLLVLSIGVGIVLGSLDLGGVGTGMLLLLLFVLDWGYFVVSEALTGGRSIGKIWFNLRVVRNNGLPITWKESLLRNLLRAADLVLFPPLLLPVAPLAMAFDRRFRRLGDLAAGTIVVVEEAAPVASRKAIPPDERILATLPPIVPLDREDLEALELFVHREQMSDARREELAKFVAAEYAARVSLPAPLDASAFLASLWSRAQETRRRER
jgi:uncharacterized RDD family membrane protein YckC